MLILQSIFSICIGILACLGLYRLYRDSPNRIFFLPALAFKLLAGLAYGWLYWKYLGQTGDSINYYHDASKLVAMGRQDGVAYWNLVLWNEYAPIWGTTLSLWQEPRAFWFVKLVSLPIWITGENYWVLSCWFSLISFWGSWVLVESLSCCFPEKRLAAVGAFLFFPSVIFFGAGLTKESLAVALLGFATGYLLRFLYLPDITWRHYAKTFAIVIVASFGLWQLKFYYLALWAGAVSTFTVSFLLARWLKPTRWGEVLLFVSVAGVGVLGASWIFNFDELVLMIVLNHNTTYIHSEADDLVHYSIYGGQGYISLDATWNSLLYNAPTALEAGLFRPYLWEANNKLKLLFSIENFILLIGVVLAALKLLKNGWLVTNTYTRLFICALVLYTFGLLIIIALASPNMGALVRYKVVVSGWIAFGVGCVLTSKKNFDFL